MLMAAATHIVGHGSAHSSSISPPPPWHPVILVPNHHHQVLYDDLATPSPSPTTPAPASPACHNHEQQHLRPASRQRPGKPQRRPRPSRKLPTTYIRTDAASFQRMVHQVTGADDDVPLLHLHGAAAAPGPEVLYRHAPAPHSRAAGLTTTTTKTDTLLLLPPTLDTSAFLMLGAAAGVGRGGAKPARPAGVSCYHGSSSVVADPGVAVQVQVKAEEACDGGGGDGFPSMELWDGGDDALF